MHGESGNGVLVERRTKNCERSGTVVRGPVNNGADRIVAIAAAGCIREHRIPP